MKRLGAALAAALVTISPMLVARAANSAPDRIPRNAQTTLVRAYLSAMRDERYADAFQLLTRDERAYYRDARNLRSIYAADAYRITAFALVGARGDSVRGRVYFARETARFRDHAHDADLTLTATVPVGVIRDPSGWRIKDPGHPWRAFASTATANANGLRITVKKISFFARRIEAVVSFVNSGANFVTILPYGKSLLVDSAGQPYRIVATRDWSLTDRQLFEGLRLAPDSQYTGALDFACEPLDDRARTFSLTVAPLFIDGADAPFALSVESIAAADHAAAARN